MAASGRPLRHKTSASAAQLAAAVAHWSLLCWQDAVKLQAQGLLQQEPDGCRTIHAVTTPIVKALQQVWA